MKTSVKKPSNPFQGLWGKNKPAPKDKTVVKAKAVSSKPEDVATRLSKPFEGPAHLVAANLLWGPDRLWPRDEASEKTLPWQAGEGTHIGILGAALGAWGQSVAEQVPTATIAEFDWRADVARWRVEREKAHISDNAFYEINLGAILPPPVRCSCILAVEPVFAQTGDTLLRWARLALESCGTLVLEELATDTPTPPAREVSNSWMARDIQSAQWLRIDEQEGLLRRNGFILGKVRERTGAHLRSLKLALEMAEERFAPLKAAIKQAPSLKNVADHFNCEQKAAKNRLKALERGALAVYRIEVIKPRADELI